MWTCWTQHCERLRLHLVYNRETVWPCWTQPCEQVKWNLADNRKNDGEMLDSALRTIQKEPVKLIRVTVWERWKQHCEQVKWNLVDNRKNNREMFGTALWTTEMEPVKLTMGETVWKFLQTPCRLLRSRQWEKRCRNAGHNILDKWVSSDTFGTGRESDVIVVPFLRMKTKSWHQTLTEIEWQEAVTFEIKRLALWVYSG